MAHPLVLALFPTSTAAAAGTRALHGLGISREQISVVSRNHDEAGALAEQMDASPGADIEDSRPAARLGELGGLVLAAIALVMPGIGPIVAAGPMSADLGEAAGHAAGGVASVLTHAGLAAATAASLQQGVERGLVLIGVHVTTGDRAAVEEALRASGASRTEAATWPD
ncbi:MAG: hypothetical protein ABIX28_18645 [Vicinamibacterales bacterium]